MSARRPRVLFVSHAGSRNGATILLLSFLRWLRPQVDWDIEVLMNGHGPLVDEFRAVARTTIWRNPETRLAALLPRSTTALQQSVVSAYAGLMLPGGEFDLVYANTAAAAPIVAHLGTRARKLLWHVHELSYALDSILTRPDWLQRFRGATRHVAVSRAVQDCLVDVHGIDPAGIDLVHGFVEARALGAESEPARRARIRAQLGIRDDVFLMGACGSLGWRKGSDVFLQVAHHLAPDQDIAFLWVGGHHGEAGAIEFEHDMRRLGLGDRCRLVPTTAEALDYYAAMDVFALTSREDPFPLVVLEAADCGVPVVCFDGGGGAIEFVGDDAGFTAPYLDIACFARRVSDLRANRALASRLGERGRARVEQSHRLERQAPLLLQAMQRCLAGESAPQTTRISTDLEPRPTPHPR